MSEIRNNILAEADEIIHGERNEQYGKAEDAFESISSYWNILLNAKMQKIFDGYDVEKYEGMEWSWEEIVEAHDVAMMMILLKVARTKGKKKRDNYVDIAGYAALAARM